MNQNTPGPGFSPDSGVLLHREVDRGGLVEVREGDALRWIYFGGEAIQAVVDTQQPDLPVLPYAKAMLTGLLFSGQPRDLLNLGVGGGTLERFLRARMPECRLCSVESSASVIRLVREFFYITEQVPIIQDAAEHFLQSGHDQYDVIFCDIHAIDGQASCLTDSSFYADARRNLNSDGVLVVNLLPATEAALLELLLVVRKQFEWVCLLDFADYRNILLFISLQPAPDQGVLEKRAEAMLQRTGLDLTGLPCRLLRLPAIPV